MKNHSYYHYIKTRRGEKSDIGRLAALIFEDTMFPKDSQDYSEVSDYLERHPYTGMSLTVYDESFEDYNNWLQH